ncbi:MAG: hypothetical protein INR65_16545 [Gluconacetobacter diazotrophicus]|nr:hypothetical protein [Gluconacetobacter diazotrophicus]
MEPSYTFRAQSDGTVAFDHHGENGVSRTIFDSATARNLLVMLERAVREAEGEESSRKGSEHRPG